MSAEENRQLLQTIRDVWFHKLLVSTWVVGIGIAMEAPDLIHETVDAFKKWPLADKANRWIKAFSFIGWILIVAGVLSEGVFEAKVSDADKNLQSFQDQEVAVAVLESGRANERAGKLEEDAAFLKHENLLLQEKLAPRSLSMPQRSKVAAELHSCQGEPLEIISLPDSPDANGLIQEIVEALSGKNGAEWPRPLRTPVSEDPYGRSIFGIWIETSESASIKDERCARMLASSLRREGLAYLVHRPDPRFQVDI